MPFLRATNLQKVIRHSFGEVEYHDLEDIFHYEPRTSFKGSRADFGGLEVEDGGWVGWLRSIAKSDWIFFKWHNFPIFGGGPE